MRTFALLAAVVCSSSAWAQVPAGRGGTAADADKGDFAPPSTGCGNVECEIAAACASANPGFAAKMCADTVRTSNAIRLAQISPSPAPIVPSDAPRLEPDGTLPPGPSVHVVKGQPAPFEGRLLDPAEYTRREKINERNAGELASYKEPGNITMARVQFILIVAGSAVAAAAAASAITIAAMDASKPKQP